MTDTPDTPDTPDNPAPEETSTPAEVKAEVPDLTEQPAGATGDDIPDAKPAEVPAEGGAADEVVAEDAGAGAEAQAVPEDVPAPREPDELRDPILEALTAALGEAVVGSVVEKGDLWVRVAPSSWRQTVQWCKDHGFTYFCFLNGIDWMPSLDLTNRNEQTYGATDESAVDAAAATDGKYETGVAGGDTRFQVFARLYDIDRKVGITLKADLDEANPSVESIIDVYRGADWHERETWEMFGFDFPGHPGLRHLYLPTEFEGFPMRKDFPLLARMVKPWPGLVDKEPIPGEDEEEAEAPA